MREKKKFLIMAHKLFWAWVKLFAVCFHTQPICKTDRQYIPTDCAALEGTEMLSKFEQFNAVRNFLPNNTLCEHNMATGYKEPADRGHL